MTTSSITLGAYNFQTEHPRELATFWSALTGGEAHPAGESVFIGSSHEHGFALFLQPLVESGPARQLGHLDLTVPWGQRVTEVERAVSLGAEEKWEVLDEHPHVMWTTLADPDGNLFCIAEHPPTG